ncbi:MAG: hypothetical protein R2838_25100 [Caldilineaceae bacterium]
MDTNLPATGPLTVLKLGGALLDKTQPYTLRTAILAQSSTRCAAGATV